MAKDGTVDFGEVLMRGANRIAEEARDQRDSIRQEWDADRSDHIQSIAHGLERASEILHEEYDRAVEDAKATRIV